MGIIKDIILNDQENQKAQQTPSKYEEALAKYNTNIDDQEVRDAVRKIIAEKVPENDNMDVKRFLFGSIELTTLKTTDSDTSVLAEEDCEILLLNVKRLLTSCPTACDHHQKLIRNLVSVLANKILLFNDKITHVSKRTTREKLLSYLSAESIRQASLSFDIPFDRQQLADFLCVERAAMSVELSKLQKEGLLVTKRNHFELLTR